MPTKYFVIGCDVPPGKRPALLEYVPDRPRRAWMLGRRFDPSIEGAVVASGRFKDDAVLPDLMQVPVPLMHRSLYEVMLGVGVSNLDVYPALISDTRAGRTYTDFVAFNVIGVVAAADLAKSSYEAPDGPRVSVDFASLSISEAAARGSMCFRLAENVSALLVEDIVRVACVAAGFQWLKFVEPVDWMG